MTKFTENMALDIGLETPEQIKKGALITLPCISKEKQNFRILSIKGTHLKVMAMYNTGAGVFNESSLVAPFEKLRIHQYANSYLDHEMNKIYESLPDFIRQAIVPQTIKQSVYAGYAGFDCEKVGEVNIGKRYVYAPDLDDIFDYFEDLQLSEGLFNQTFFETPEPTSDYVWLRSAKTLTFQTIWSINGYKRCFDYYGYYFQNNIRPMFVIDLVKLAKDEHNEEKEN